MARSSQSSAALVRQRNSKAPRLMLRLGMALPGGVALWATLPPRGWWLLGPVAVALLACSLSGLPARRRGLAGFAFGLGWFVPGLAWMWEFSGPGALVATLLEAAVVAMAAMVVPPRRGRLVAVPGVLVLAEAARSRWPFGGLPLAGPALGQVEGPLLSTVAVGGGLLIVGLVAVAGVAVAAVVERRRAPVVASLLLVVAVVLAAPAADGTRPVGTVRAAVAQGGGPRGIPAVLNEDAQLVERHVGVSRDISPPVDLVVWPEGVIDVERPVATTAAGQAAAGLARRLDTTLVAGVVEAAGPRNFRNAALAWGPDGRIVDRYDKVHRVPFGEYIPFRDVVSRIADVSLVPRDALPGAGPPVLDTPVGRLGVAISFEVFFPERVRAAVRAGGTVLLVPTNATSYTGPAVPTQEVAAARLRAVETGRAVLQAAPTGLSVIIDRDGRVLARSTVEQPALLEGEVPLVEGTTLYTRTGDLPVLVLAGLAVASGWLRRRVRR